MKFNTTKLATPQLILLILLFCAATFKNVPLPEAIRPHHTASPTVRNDSIEVTKSIVGFLHWYKINLNKAGRFPLLAKDKEGYYMVNKKACSDYLNFLKNSHFISPKYISCWQTYFDDKAMQLKKDKLESDIPEGFNMDFILFTQEPELILNKIDSLTFNIVSMNKSEALIGLTFPSDSTVSYKFEMNKSKAGWQISYISSSNFD